MGWFSRFALISLGDVCSLHDNSGRLGGRFDANDFIIQKSFVHLIYAWRGEFSNRQVWISLSLQRGQIASFIYICTRNSERGGCEWLGIPNGSLTSCVTIYLIILFCHIHRISECEKRVRCFVWAVLILSHNI